MTAGQDGLFGGVFARGGVDVSDLAWLQCLLDTEAALARALEQAGLAPTGAGAAVTAAASAAAFDLADLGRQAAQTGSPVPALVRALTAAVPATAAGAVHHGATSQDIIDTAAMLLARQALGVIAADLAGAAADAAALATPHRETPTKGRTLLQQAVPVTFGLVAAGWLTALDDAGAGLARIAAGRLAVQFGGAAGTLAPLGADGPRVARLLAAELGLAAPVLPWHTDRLRITQLGAGCAGVTSVLGKIARDVTLLAQTEVGEVTEGEPPRRGRAGLAAPPGGRVRRGGSSAMPHKRNPVAAVAILGCTRQVPGLLATLVACAEQEHQRAAGAWHAEWQPLTSLLRLTGAATAWGAELLDGLVVHPGRMRANLAATGGLVQAEQVVGVLAPAIGRVAAYDLIAAASGRAAEERVPLRDVLLRRPQFREQLDAAGIAPGQVEAALDPAAALGAAAQFVEAALDAYRSR